MNNIEIEKTINEVDVKESPIDSEFSSMLTTLTQFKVQITALSNQLKGLEKIVKKEIKTHKKVIHKKTSKGGNNKLSGFAAAGPISKELCNFMGKTYGTEIARTEVTKYVCAYIKEHSLTATENNRVIKPDNKLQGLLGTDDSTTVTYFNIQRFMNKHFLKNTEDSSTSTI